MEKISILQYSRLEWFQLTCSARDLQCQDTCAALQSSMGFRKERMYRERQRGSTEVKSMCLIGTASSSLCPTNLFSHEESTQPE